MHSNYLVSENLLENELLNLIKSSLDKQDRKVHLLRVDASEKNGGLFDTLLHAFLSGDQRMALTKFEKIRRLMEQNINMLPDREKVLASTRLKTLYTELEWMLYDEPVNHEAYYTAQIHCFKSLMSSAFTAAWLAANGLSNHWLDARDFIKTTEDFPTSTVLADISEREFSKLLNTSNNSDLLFITQYGIGSTEDNESTLPGHWGQLETALSTSYGLVMMTFKSPISFQLE